MRPVIQPFCRFHGHLLRDLVEADSPRKILPQKAISVFVCPRCHGECGLQKYVLMPVARSSSLNRAISEPLSRVKVFRRPGGISHKRGTSASLKAAAVLLSTLANTRKRLLRSLQLTSAALPLEAQTRSPSQSPNRNRSATTCGRWDISTRPRNMRLPWLDLVCRLRARRK